MNWLKQLNDSLNYIEENIEEDIRCEDVASKAFSSYHHFSRMFYALSGVNLGEYIRNRRLTLAASDLVKSNEKIIEVALKYQYKTPESFSKAFKRFHGVSPKEAKSKQPSLKIFSKLSFQINVKGDYIMNYKIIKESNLKFVGIEKTFTTDSGQNFVEIPKMWGEVMNDGTFNEMIEQCDNLGVVGLCHGFDNKDNTFKYLIGVRENSKTKFDGVKTDFGEQTFAVFEAKGPLPSALQNVIKQVYSEWFPSSSYEHSGGPEIEVYSKGDSNSEDYMSYYWVPIKEKK